MTLGFLLWFATTLLPQPLADQACLATTVYLEARGEPTTGQRAVAEVALRRQDSGRWGDSICDVVTAPWQFAPATTPKSFQIANLEAWNEAWKIAGQSMHNWGLPATERVVVVPHANHFVVLAEVTPDWATGQPIRTIGDHSFYDVK